jgi:hypothetical protein
MAATLSGVRALLSTPSVQNADGQLTLGLSIANVGDTLMDKVQVTTVTLGSAARVSPAVWPVVIPRIGAGGTGAVVVRFASAGLAVGARLLLTVRASYQVGANVLGLTLSRFVTVPAASAATPSLRARMAAIVRPNYWDYRVDNLEVAGSAQHIASFALSVDAPVQVTGTPPGWAVDTDSATYVLWYATDIAAPYPNHVAPGQSLGGFQLMSQRRSSESIGASLVAWNHSSNEADLVFSDYLAVPSRLG